jgi:HK97 family phage major capsid protein
MKKLKELRQRLAALTTEERAQLERIKAEERAMDATETEQYEKRAADIAKVEAEISELEKVEQRERAARERDERLSAQRTSEPERPAGGNGSPDAELEMRAHRNHLRGGLRRLSEAEVRALTVGTDSEGGYLKTPMQVVGEILKGVDNEVFVRNLARKFTVGDSEGIGVPTLDADVDDAVWTSELATGAEDTALRFGKRELRPHPIAKRIKVSNKLIRSSVIDIVGYINQRFTMMKPKFTIYDSQKQEIGQITGDWKGWNFIIHA